MTVTVEHTRVYVVPAPEIASLFDAFFNFATAHEFKRQMSCVELEFPCVITSSASLSSSSAASSLDA